MSLTKMKEKAQAQAQINLNSSPKTDELPHFEYEGNAVVTSQKPQQEVCFDISNSNFLPIMESDGSITLSVVEKTNVAFRQQVVVDFGFSFKVPKGLKAVVEIAPRWAERGGLVRLIDYQDHVKIVLGNCGKEILVFNSGDHFATLWFNPIQKVGIKLNMGDK